MALFVDVDGGDSALSVIPRYGAQHLVVPAPHFSHARKQHMLSPRTKVLQAVVV